jgi:hypothetical protein
LVIFFLVFALAVETLAAGVNFFDSDLVSIFSTASIPRFYIRFSADVGEK